MYRKVHDQNTFFIDVGHDENSFNMTYSILYL